MDHLDKNFEEFSKEDRLAAAEKREIISSRTAVRIYPGIGLSMNHLTDRHSIRETATYLLVFAQDSTTLISGIPQCRTLSGISKD